MSVSVGEKRELAPDGHPSFPSSIQVRNQGENGMFLELNFTGKETDCETGYSYFGARYYDPTLLTSWTAVDPMADKYPSLSPYNYCAWNPMKLVDPDGNEFGDYFSVKGVWLGSDGKDDGKIFRQVNAPSLLESRGMPNNYVFVGVPCSFAGTYEYVGDVTGITMDYTGSMAPDKNNNPHIAQGTLRITLNVGDQGFVRGEYDAWSGCNMKDGSVRYPLQNGKWQLANSDRPVTAKQRKSYTRDNACFKIDFTALFKGNARTGLQIHPDGGADGTAGCIGIRSNPANFLEAYKSCVRLNPNLEVNVNINGNPNDNVPH